MIAAGDTSAWQRLGDLLSAKPDCKDAAEAAYRNAIDAGYNDGWIGVGALRSKQPGREAEAA